VNYPRSYLPIENDSSLYKGSRISTGIHIILQVLPVCLFVFCLFCFVCCLLVGWFAFNDFFTFWF